MLHECYDTSTGVLQCYYGASVRVFHACYGKARTRDTGVLRDFCGSAMGKLGEELRECYGTVSRGLRDCYKIATQMLRECYWTGTGALQECYGVLREFCGIAAGVSREQSL